MTEEERPKIYALFMAFWPKWSLNDQRKDILFSMFGRHEVRAVEDAIRRHYHEEPDSIRPQLKTIRHYLARGSEYKQAVSGESLELELHRNHYRQWAHRGWKYPGDRFVLDCVRRNRETPLQAYCRDRIAAIFRAELDDAPIAEPPAELYQIPEAQHESWLRKTDRKNPDEEW